MFYLELNLILGFYKFSSKFDLLPLVNLNKDVLSFLVEILF